MKDVNRREFLAGAAVAGAGVLLAGCTPQQKGASASSAGDASAVEDKAKAEFEALRAPIPPVEPPAKWDDSTDVLVVGSGAGGVFASLRLAMAGYKVMLLEREDVIGGATRYGANNFTNLGGHRQANEAGWAVPEFPYNPQKVVEYVVDQQNMSGDIELLYELAVQGPKCIDWMVDTLGLNWHGSVPVPAANGALLMWDAENNFVKMGDRFTIYEKMLKDAGVDIRCGSEVVALVQNADGRIVGLKVADGKGEVFYEGKRAVALTAGGFELNRSLMQEYCPNSSKVIANIACPPFATGEIFRMGLGVNADVSGFDSMGSFESGIWWQEYGEYDPYYVAYTHNMDGNTVVRQPWLRINKFGERVPYLSTSGTTFPYQTSLPNVVNPSALCDQASLEMAQPDGKTYVCFDAKYYDLLMADYFGQKVCRLVGSEEMDPFHRPHEMHWSVLMEGAVEQGGIKKADTIEELEQMLGLDAGVLVESVKKWNAACETGEDYALAFKYPKEWLIALDTPPYYGSVVGGNPFGTKCGLMVNPQMQVISKDRTAIPGLYAGWHTAGGSSGEMNYGGRPGTGMLADGGLAYTGGYMIAGAIMAEDGIKE